MNPQFSIYDFDAPRRDIENAAAEAEFQVIDLCGPALSGKTSLLVQMFCLTRRSELVVHLDFKRTSGPDEIVRYLIAAAAPKELNCTKDELRRLAKRDVVIQQSTIRNSQVSINAGGMALEYQKIAALSFNQDLSDLDRGFIVVLDHTHMCTPDAAPVVDSIADAMFSNNIGTLIVARQSKSPQLARFEYSGTSPLKSHLFDRAHRTIDIPRFDAADVSEFARHLLIEDDQLNPASIARSSQGIPGLVSLCLGNHRVATDPRSREVLND